MPRPWSVRRRDCGKASHALQAVAIAQKTCGLGPVIVFAFMQAAGMVDDHGLARFRPKLVRPLPD